MLKSAVRRRIGAFAAAGLAAATILAVTAPGAHAADDLADASFTFDNGTTTGTATYTWTFHTPASSTVLAAGGTITLGIPGATRSSSTLTVYGVDCGDLAIDGTSTNTSIVLKTAAGCTVAGNRSVGITINNLTNVSALTGAATSTIAFGSHSSTATVPTSSNTTNVKVLVPESITLSPSTSNISLTAIPGVEGEANKVVSLNIDTNATNGYDLHACVNSTTTHALTDGTHYIGSSSTTAGALTTGGTPNVGFGGRIGTPTGSVTVGGQWNSTDGTDTAVVGYGGDCNDSGTVIAYDHAAASADVIPVDNFVLVTGSQPAGVNTGTIQYTAVPHF